MKRERGKERVTGSGYDQSPLHIYIYIYIYMKITMKPTKTI
jgi:hypothetical protein